MSTTKKRKSFTFPHSYALLFFMVILAAASTWLIPSGQFDSKKQMVDGTERTVILPGTFHEIGKISDGVDHRQGLAAILEAPGN